MSVMIAIQPVMLAQISYLRNAPNVKVAFTYGKEHVNLHALNLPTNSNKASNALKLALIHTVCKNHYACLPARGVLLILVIIVD